MAFKLKLVNMEPSISAALGGATDPVVHLGRPEALPRGGARSLWLVVSASGDWLACGHAETFARMPLPRVNYDSDVPAFAKTAIELAIARGAESWKKQIADETRAREYVANRQAALRACESRMASLQEEMRQIREQIDANS